MSGFLRGHSWCSALLKLTDDWRQALDNEKDVAVVVIKVARLDFLRGIPPKFEH